MASRIIHLAAAYAMLEDLPIEHNDRERNRFFIGSVLPDAVMSADKAQSNSHFIELYDGGRKKHYDFAAFFERYESEILSDRLYLGYYFHLIEDGIFRILLYYDLKLLPKRGNPEFLRTLYEDYHILNGRLVKSHGLKNNLYVPENFDNERICEIYRFDIEDFAADMAGDFSERIDGVPTYLTAERTDAYIARCREVCIREYKAILSGGHYLNRYDFSFENKEGYGKTV